MIKDPILNYKLTFSKAQSISESGLLKVQITLQSLTGKILKCEYMFEWFDQNDFKIDNILESWIPIDIYGYEIKEIVAVAPTAKAKNFRFHIRKANPLY